MVATRVGTIRTVVCASPQFLAGHGVPQEPADLAALPIVNFDVIAPALAWSFHRKAGGGVQDLPIKPRLSVSTAEAAVAAAREGVGVTRVLHYQCADAVRDDALRIILLDFEPQPLPVHLIHAGSGALPAKTRFFLNFAVKRLRTTLSAM